MVEQNCKILIAFLLFLNCTIESRYWSGEGEMQKIAIPENRMVVGREPLFYLEDKNDRNLKSLKRSGSYGNIRLLKKKRNEPNFGIRLLQI